MSMQPENSPKPTLGRLEKVDLTAYWQGEETDFTPWLAQVENIKLLGDTIGLELEVVAEEQRVGSFRVDLLCRDTATDRWVLIENQLEATDHLHLGQLVTYAAGLNAATVIWVASHFSAEHRAALDWLNQISQEEFNFFGLEIELWRIGDSAMAAKFNLVSQPNGWAKTVTKARDEELTETQRQYLEFWSGLCQLLDQRGSIVKPGDPATKGVMGFAIGRAGFRLYATVDPEDQCLYAELHLSGEDAQPYFYLLEEDREQIEVEMGMPLTWDAQADNKDCSIYCTLPNANLAAQDQWTDYYQWLCLWLERFHEVFSERVKHLNANDYRPKPNYSFNPLKNPLILPN